MSELSAEYLNDKITKARAAIAFAVPGADLSFAKATLAAAESKLAALPVQAPAEPVQFVCTACTYPSRKADCCDNPACLSNPSLSESFKQSLRDRAAAFQAERAADEARRANRAALRRQGFTTAF
ncbi:MAG: hypothetical protein EOS07_22105 [Mesorhizobium sp.]|nr:MAG: hypothetical protein EOS07_22105 [Mesorhizobium sp.]